MAEDHEDTDTTIDENTPRAMINLERLLELVPVSQSTMQRLERKGTFPSSRIIAGRKVWFADEVARWQRNLSNGPRRSPRVRGQIGQT